VGSRGRDRVQVRMSKWDGTPHWAFEAVTLGDDEHGTWLGTPAGTRFARPGAAYEQAADRVHLVGDSWCLPSFCAPGAPMAVYVDISTPPDLDGGLLEAIDLDLDVVRGWTGRTWVDDEDEFAAHRVAQGYPTAVVEAAHASCEQVLAALRAGLPPYDGTARAWLERVGAR